MSSDPVKAYNVFLGMLPQIGRILIQVIIIVAILLIGRKLVTVLCRMIDKALTKVDIDMGIKKFLTSLVRVACYVLMVFIIADRLGVSSASLVAVLGSAGIAIGLALQGSLANFAGGILILFMKPFVVGDYIQFPGGEGVVKSVDLVYTTIVSIDNKVITIPNGSLSNGVITNMTKLEYRRVDITVGISYGSDIKKAKEIMQQVYENEELILKEKGITVYVDNLGESSVVLGGRGWCKTPDYWNARWAVTEQVKLAYDGAGIEIPYNQVDVHMIGDRG